MMLRGIPVRVLFEKKPAQLKMLDKINPLCDEIIKDFSNLKIYCSIDQKFQRDIKRTFTENQVIILSAV